MPEARRFQESRMPGNPLVRFDEGRVGRTQVSPSLLLYRPIIVSTAHIAFRSTHNCYRDDTWFAASSCSTFAANSSFSFLYSSPLPRLGNPACTLLTSPSRPTKNVVGQESQSRACVSFSLAEPVSPPSRTSYLIPYCLMSVFSRVGSASCSGSSKVRATISSPRE